MTGTLAPTVLVGCTRRQDAVQLAQDLAHELLGEHPGPLHHSCPTCGSIEHGRPSFDAAVSVSLAHAPSISLVAVGIGAALGVDVEPVGAADFAWVETEALGKAHGVGLTSAAPVASPARTRELQVPGHRAALVVLAAELPNVTYRTEVLEAQDPRATS